MRVQAAQLACLALLLPACAATSIRSQSPEAIADSAIETRLVGDIAVPDGMQPVAVEAVALVTGLDGTGSDPPAGPERSALLDEMQKRGVVNPNQVLASPSTSLVFVRGYLRAGMQKGDRFDVEVRVPSRSETTSLRDGWLMEARLREMAAIGDSVHQGHVLALAKGPILTDPAAGDEAGAIAANRGRILGGGVAQKSRPLRLVLKPEHRSVRNSAMIGTALNRRFSTFQQGIKQGIATPKTDEYVELIAHPRYKNNISRYMQVVRSVALRESAAEQMERIKLLERQLLDPITADAAALRLEALGKAGADTLAKATGSSDPLVRFYAAEALAYLDDPRGIAPLAEAARDEPAFRVFALSALGAMDDFAAYQALRELLEVASAETRYGAFRALWSMNPHDSLTEGENLGDQFSLHVLPVGGPPLIHLTRSFRPEVVLFGSEHHLKTPMVLEASKRMLIKAEAPDNVVVSRFAVGSDVEKRVVSDKVDEIIRAMAELGASYPDVVQTLHQAKKKQVLDSRLAVDALPEPGRAYERDRAPGEPGSQGREPTVSNPVPDLFARPRDDFKSEKAEGDQSQSASTASTQAAGRKKGLLGRLSR
jgi:flagellar basal body P-ring protein FlgI